MARKVESEESEESEFLRLVGLQPIEYDLMRSIGLLPRKFDAVQLLRLLPFKDELQVRRGPGPGPGRPARNESKFHEATGRILKRGKRWF